MLVCVKKQILEVETWPETRPPTFSPDQDEDPDTPKSVRFRVKETVCGKAERQLPEQCAFKEQGVKQRVGGGGASCGASQGVPREYFYPVD